MDDFMKNVLLFYALHTDKDVNEKCREIENYLKCGSNVNATDSNDYGNTPLHKAVKNEELKVIELLLKYGADLSIKNKEGYTPLDTAKLLPINATVQEIIEALSEEKPNIQNTEENNHKIELPIKDKRKIRYKKKTGTAGVGGQLYESKLLSLILFRAFENNEITDFHLGANIAIGDFDDICFKCKLKEEKKPKVVFIQAKHKENRNNSLSLNLLSYYDSYIKIKKHFKRNCEDVLFDSSWEETDCKFVIYTPSKNILDDKYKKNKSACPWLEKIICAGANNGDLFQITDSDLLIKLKTSKAIESLGKSLNVSLLKNNEKKYTEMLAPHYLDGVIRKYHVVLAQNVVNVSNDITIDAENESKKYRIGTFRREFLTSTDESWTLLRKKIFENISETDRSKFESEAFTFKLPQAFGNIDVYVNDSGRIDWLVNNFDKIFKSHKNTTIKINNSFCKENGLNNGFISLNGGIESMIGNLLIYDEHTKMLKFCDKYTSQTQPETQNTNAEKLFIELSKKAEGNYNLLDFRFDVQLNDFTTLFLHGGEIERKSVTEYLSLLWFFTDQAKENEVECTLKKEIENKNKNGKSNHILLRIHADAIFLKLHDEVQKWWMLPGEADYLSLSCDFYEKSKNAIIDSPILTVSHFVYASKINKSQIKFKNTAIENFELHINKNIIIISRECFLTSMKIYQYYETYKDIIFLDLESIINEGYYSTVLSELENTTLNIFVLIHRNNDNTQYLLKSITKIKEASTEKRIILITETNLPDNAIKYEISDWPVKKDENINLIDVDNYECVLKNWIVLFQGRETTLDRVVDESTIHLINSKIILKGINKECFDIGHPIVTSRYEEVKQYCVDRNLSKKEFYTNNIYAVKTFFDIEENVVLIVAEAGMGKSVLLNQLAEHTKRMEDISKCESFWIVNINLTDYCRDFKEWKNINTKIDRNDALRFITNTAMKNLKNVAKKGEDSKLYFVVSEDGDDINLLTFDVDHIAKFEIELFLHFYKKGLVILLFDGFDEICPHYEDEVISLLKLLIPDTASPSSIFESTSNCEVIDKKQIKLWVTSRPYNHVRNILEKNLQTEAYTLQGLTKHQQSQYLKKYFCDNILNTYSNSAEANNFYLHNIVTALRLDAGNIVDRLFDIVADDFLNYLIRDSYIKYSPSVQSHINDRLVSMSSIPLHLYIAAEYYVCQIRDGGNLKWFKERNSFNFFEFFLEIKFKKIRFEEKRQVDISNPDNEMSYNLEYKDFIDKHKKIALCALFDDKDLRCFLSRDELDNIHQLIARIEAGEEKTGVIHNVVDDVPRFVHIVFAEYFAVEFICDCVGNSQFRLYDVWHFIINIILNESSGGVRTFFDWKISSDARFRDTINCFRNKEIVFEVLMQQTYSRYKNSFDVVLEEECLNILYYFVDCFESNLRPRNLDIFLNFIRESFVYISCINGTQMDVLNRIWHRVQRVNGTNRMDLSFFLDLIPGWHKNSKFKK